MIFGNLFKKREQAPVVGGIGSGWYPAGGYTQKEFQNLGVVSLALRLYSDACIRFPLVIKDKNGRQVDHSILRVLEKPNSFQDKAGFFGNLASSVLIYGNFHSKIKFNASGEVEKLLSYPTRDLWAYPVVSGQGAGNNFSDPIKLEEQGYYYRDSKARIFLPYEVLHIKDSISVWYDQLNARSRIRSAIQAFDSGKSIQDSVMGISEGSFIPPLIITSPPAGDADKKKQVKTKLEQFFATGNRSRKMLFLPDGYSSEPMSIPVTGDLLELIKKISDSDMARVFNIQSIIGIEGSPQAAAKEAYRALLSIALKPFLIHVSNAFTNQLLSESDRMRGLKFEFETQALSSQDLREQSTFLKAMVETGILSPNEARLKLNLPRDQSPESDLIKPHKIEIEQVKQEEEYAPESN